VLVIAGNAPFDASSTPVLASPVMQEFCFCYVLDLRPNISNHFISVHMYDCNFHSIHILPAAHGVFSNLINCSAAIHYKHLQAAVENKCLTVYKDVVQMVSVSHYQQALVRFIYAFELVI
jgi:hypothetical protein